MWVLYMVGREHGVGNLDQSVNRCIALDIILLNQSFALISTSVSLISKCNPNVPCSVTG